METLYRSTHARLADVGRQSPAPYPVVRQCAHDDSFKCDCPSQVGLVFVHVSDSPSVCWHVPDPRTCNLVARAGLSDKGRNISNALIAKNIFIRNGAIQTSEDHGEIAFMEYGSTGAVLGNTFFASDTDSSFVFHEARKGTLDFGWTVSNNTVHNISALKSSVADTPAIQSLVFENGSAEVVVESRVPRPLCNTTVLWSLDGSWPQEGAAGTTATTMEAGGTVKVVVGRTSALNVRFAVDGLLTSLTTTIVIEVPILPSFNAAMEGAR